MRPKLDAVLRQLSQVRERKDLKTAGVCQKRSIPRGETMQPAKLLDHIYTRSEEKVVGVPEDDPRVHLALEPLEANALESTLCADRHEDRRLDDRAARAQR